MTLGRLNIVYGSSRGHKLTDSIIGTTTTTATTLAAGHVESSFSRKFFVFFFLWYICRASFWFYGQRAWGMNNGRILSKSFTTFAKVFNSTQTICDCFAHTHTRTQTHTEWHTHTPTVGPHLAQSYRELTPSSRMPALAAAKRELKSAKSRNRC